MPTYPSLGLPLDLNNWDRLNENFKQIGKDIDDVGKAAFELVVNQAKLDWLSPVDKLEDLEITYPTPEEGNAAMVRNTGNVYRFDGLVWVEIQDIDPTVINEVDARLSSEIGKTNQKNATTVYVVDYKNSSTGDDWTQAIQDAINYAGSLIESSNAVGASLYYYTRADVVLPAKRIKTSSVINCPLGIGIKSEGRTVLVASTPDKTIDAFKFDGTAKQTKIDDFTFVGYKGAIIGDTNDVDVSTIELNRVNFHMCSVGLDTVSYVKSRSTIVKLNNCVSWKTDTFVKNYTDKMVLQDCWVTHSGYNGPAIYNDGNLLIEGGIYVPTAGGGARWIDNYANAGECGLFIDGARFGAEGGGGMTIVYNYATYDTNLASNRGKIISIKNCQLASAGSASGRRSTIVLFAMPNQISMENNFGFFDLIEGIVSVASSLDTSSVDSRYANIDLDRTIYQSSNFPRVSVDLERFLSENKPLVHPYSNKKEYNFKLSDKQKSVLRNGGSEILYTVGLINGYTVGIFEITIIANKSGVNDVSQKVYRARINNATSNNTVTSVSAVSAEEKLANVNVQYTFNATIVDSKLSISITNTMPSSELFINCSGDVSLVYLPSGGQSVYEN